MKSHIAIAIDGPAASGKSTLAGRLSERLNLTMVNSGEMYRAVTWRLLDLRVDVSDASAVVEALGAMDLECGVEGRMSTIKVDGLHPGTELRSEAVNRSVSTVSAVPEVRRRLVELQREYLDFTDVVMEGRDIGSVVFPDTPFKIYIDADADVRAKRRTDVGEVDSVLDRDREDSSRKTAPLMVPDGAARLDTSKHTIESGVLAALEILRGQGLDLEERS
ncbi:(d)CMP kinase [Haloferula sp. A504]|uniref:(d)CMP kinase n=1 Tax=Haloferula sp. A504 TaxID=3373601 RepID=UPI0031CA5037|nr:(d)CMP kinase [Verrucomicrobiaceae bacterium E54]